MADTRTDTGEGLPTPTGAIAPNGRMVKWDDNYLTEPWLSHGYVPLYTAEQVRQAQREAVAAALASHPAQAGAPVYQVQYQGTAGTSLWHDATEAAYHTFMPERRRIVYAAPIPPQAGAREEDQQANVMPPFAAPASQHDADAVDAARYRAIHRLMTTAKGSASLTVNQHLAYYEECEPGEEVSLQWYPDTPIGFYTIDGSTLDEVADAAIEAARSGK